MKNFIKNIWRRWGKIFQGFGYREWIGISALKFRFYYITTRTGTTTKSLMQPECKPWGVLLVSMNSKHDKELSLCYWHLLSLITFLLAEKATTVGESTLHISKLFILLSMGKKEAITFFFLGFCFFLFSLLDLMCCLGPPRVRFSFNLCSGAEGHRQALSL